MYDAVTTFNVYFWSCSGQTYEEVISFEPTVFEGDEMESWPSLLDNNQTNCTTFIIMLSFCSIVISQSVGCSNISFLFFSCCLLGQTEGINGIENHYFSHLISSKDFDSNNINNCFSCKSTCKCNIYLTFLSI